MLSPALIDGRLLPPANACERACAPGEPIVELDVRAPARNLSMARYFGLLALCIAIFPASAAAQPAAPIGYNRDIRPLLADNCFACHGPDKNNRKAKLRLDDRDVAVTKKAIVPGQPDKSELVARIFSAEETEVMPP